MRLGAKRVLLGVALLAVGSCGPPPYLTPPEAYPSPLQVIQQLGGSADIPVRYRCGFACQGLPVEARWGGGAWTLLDDVTNDGWAEGVLPAQPVGWGTLELRIEGSAEILDAIPDVGVGDVFVIAGQSNAVMRLQTEHASQLGATVLPLNGVHADAADPFHPSPAIPDEAGSVWPLLADRIIAKAGHPVMFVATARDGTGLVKPKDWKARVPGVEEHGVFWNRMIQNTIAATPGGASHCVMAVLWFQGERDAGLGVAGQDYQDGLEDFADSLPIEWGCTVPVVAARIGPVAGVPEEQIQAIRDAQTDAIAAHPDILAGPVTEDLPVKLDGVHFGDPAADALLERWCAAIQPLYAASLDCAP